MKHQTYYPATSLVPIYLTERTYCTFEFESLYGLEVLPMKEKRKKDFLHGRFLAHQILGSENKIAQTKTGAPEVGSLSHSALYVAFSFHPEVELVGVDVEELLTLELVAEIQNKVFTAVERSFIKNSRDPRLAATLIFSAKESFYKCYHPILQRFVDFQEVSVAPDLEGGRFGLTFEGQVLEGFWGQRPHALFTLVYKK